MPGTENRSLPPLAHSQAARLRGITRKNPPWIEAELWSDPEDERVFAALYAVYWRPRTASSRRREPWLARGVLLRDAEGRPVLARLAVEHRNDDSIGVTNHVLHLTPVDEFRKQALAALARRKEARAILHDTGWNVAPWPETPQRAGAGRPGYTDEELRKLTLRAVELQAQRRQRIGQGGIRERLAGEFDKRTKTIDYMVRRARDEGWMAKVAPGERDFRLGPRLLAEGRETT